MAAASCAEITTDRQNNQERRELIKSGVILVLSFTLSFVVVEAVAIQEPPLTIKAKPDGVAISAAEDLRQIMAS